MLSSFWLWEEKRAYIAAEEGEAAIEACFFLKVSPLFVLQANAKFYLDFISMCPKFFYLLILITLLDNNHMREYNIINTNQSIKFEVKSMKENHFKIKPSPEQVERRNRLSEITAHILNILAKYKCDRDEIDGVLYNVNCEIKKLPIQYKENFLDELTRE